MRFTLNCVTAFALREGALFLPADGVLVVSDLHLEKGSAFAMRGQMLPPYDTAATLKRVEALIQLFQPRTVVSLGDSFHDSRAGERLHASDRMKLRALTRLVDWVWITGNHDPAPPEGLGGSVAAEWNYGPLVLRHEPSSGPVIGEIAGHLHPCATVVTAARTLRRRCFITDGQRLIMPAFGAFTGGLNVRDSAFHGLWGGPVQVLAMGDSRLVSVKVNSLAQDRARPKTP